jgi:anti-sigma factor RsiW
MNHCPFQPLLTPYHDGELGATAQRRLNRHLLACPACAAALAELRGLSSRIAASVDSEEPRSALAGMHRAIDRAAANCAPARGAPRPLLRFAAPLGALAASILIIAGVWLLDPNQPASLPDSAAPSFAPVAVAPDWERVAVTLRAEPRADILSDSPFSPRYAAIHWMLDSLASAPTEDKPWPLPSSF